MMPRSLVFVLEYTEGHHISHDTDQSILCPKSLHNGAMGESMKRQSRGELSQIECSRGVLAHAAGDKGPWQAVA